MKTKSKNSSVVLAAWNGEKYIGQQLDSIVHQSAEPQEILIRDDCSTDQTVRTVEEWKKIHPETVVKIITSETNEGYRHNFFELLKKAESEWVFLSDQDDIWSPGKVETMMEIVKHNPDIRLLTSNCRLIDSQGSLLPGTVRYPDNWLEDHLNEDLILVEEDLLLKHNYFQGCTMMVQRDLIKDFLKTYDESLPHDWALALTAAVKGQMYYTNLPLLNYRIHESNTIGVQKKRTFQELIQSTLNYDDRTREFTEMHQALKYAKKISPQTWNGTKEEMLNFCQEYLAAINEKSLLRYWQLKKAEAFAGCIPRRFTYYAGMIYILFGRKAGSRHE